MIYFQTVIYFLWENFSSLCIFANKKDLVVHLLWLEF